MRVNASWSKKESQKIREKIEKRGQFINFIDIGGICNMHHWFRGKWTPLFVMVRVKPNR